MTVQILPTALVVVLILGTGVLYTLAVSLGRGCRASVSFALGCTLGIVPHLLTATLGLVAVLHASALLFQIVEIAGMAYLLYLAWQALKSNGTLAMQASPDAQPGWHIARRAALINILNPKLSVFFMALLPPFLTGGPATASIEMIALGAFFMAMTFAVVALYGVFSETARSRLLASQSVMRWLNQGFAALFATPGLCLALEKA